MKLFLLSSLVFSFQAFAQVYKKVPVVNHSKSTAEVVEVKLLSAKDVSAIGEFGNFEDRHIEITLGIKAIASLCESMKEIELLPAQSSLDSDLNPSDFYLRVNTSWEDGCATGSSGNPEYIKYVVKYWLDQRPASDAGKPWRKPDFFAKSNIRHFSFDSGMLGGLNRWKLYKLNYGNLKDVKFDYVKQFSFVQGQVVEQ